MRSSVVALAFLPVVASLNLGLNAPSPNYASLDERGDPLRSTFNADIGKVRVLMLVAPT